MASSLPSSAATATVVTSSLGARFARLLHRSPHHWHLHLPLRPSHLILPGKVVQSASSSSSSSSAAASAMASTERQLAAAMKAASLASKLCQVVQKGLSQSDVQSKSDKSPVTIADYGSQALVSFVLGKELASEPFSMVAEEDSGDLHKDGNQEILQRITELVNTTLSVDGTYNASLTAEDVLVAIDKGKSEGGPHGSHWVLDPIDGTKGFVRGDQYAIALALIVEGELALGILACPNLPLAPLCELNNDSAVKEVGCLFFAKAGGGTFMETLDGLSRRKISVTSIENPIDASFYESFEAAHSMHDLHSSIAKRLGIQAPSIRIDSQAKYGALARGDGAIYLRFPRQGYREKIWDHAAGSIVITEAGGVVTDAAGNPLDFSKGKHLDVDAGIIATNQKLMPTVLKAVQEAIKEKFRI